MKTLPGEKYRKAIWWCENHHSMLPFKSKWRVMHLETLYAFLESINVRWSSKRKVWYVVGGKTDPVRVRRGKVDRGVESSRAVSVRITADKRDIDTIISEFMELAEALNWEATLNSRKYDDINGITCRQYITVRKLGV